MCRYESTATLRKRLSSWVAEKISGKRYADVADVSIEALKKGLLQRGAWKPLACWCESCDIKANAGFRTHMSVCPECGDKRCPKAHHHDNRCGK